MKKIVTKVPKNIRLYDGDTLEYTVTYTFKKGTVIMSFDRLEKMKISNCKIIRKNKKIE